MTKLLPLAILALSLAACGGGGGSSPNPPAPVPTATPTPTPTPTPIPPANTSLSYYLPLYTGNVWRFNTGSYISDVGSYSLNCSCPWSNNRIENLDLYDTTGTYAGTFVYAKTPNPGNTTMNGGGEWTVLVGISSDHGQTITIIQDPTTGDTGIGVMEDIPAVGDYWTNDGGTSTITAINGTVMLPSGFPIIDVATDNLSDSSAGLNQNWQYAKGVGFAGLSQGSQSATVTSFTVDTRNSYAIRARANKVTSRTTVGSAIRIFGKLLR